MCWEKVTLYFYILLNILLQVRIHLQFPTPLDTFSGIGIPLTWNVCLFIVIRTFNMTSTFVIDFLSTQCCIVNYTMLYSASLELNYLAELKLYTLWTTTLHFPLPISPGNMAGFLSFLKLNNILSYVCTTFSLSIHLSMDI